MHDKGMHRVSDGRALSAWICVSHQRRLATHTDRTHTCKQGCLSHGQLRRHNNRAMVTRMRNCRRALNAICPPPLLVV
jgi:hypothetical protein